MKLCIICIRLTFSVGFLDLKKSAHQLPQISLSMQRAVSVVCACVVIGAYNLGKLVGFTRKWTAFTECELHCLLLFRIFLSRSGRKLHIPRLLWNLLKTQLLSPTLGRIQLHCSHCYKQCSWCSQRKSQLRQHHTICYDCSLDEAK